MGASSHLVAVAAGLPWSCWMSAPPSLKAPWREPESSLRTAALGVGQWAGSPAGGTGSVRSARQGPGHNAALPLDARAHTHCRHLPGCAWTGASSRQPGLRQLLPAWDRPRPPAGEQQPRGQGLGGGTVREQPDCLAPPHAERPTRGLDMSAQEPPQGRRFPIEAGDSPRLAATPESQDSPEPVATEHNPVR